MGIGFVAVKPSSAVPYRREFPSGELKRRNKRWIFRFGRAE
jgi:hypothetical protein